MGKETQPPTRKPPSWGPGSARDGQIPARTPPRSWGLAQGGIPRAAGGPPPVAAQGGPSAVLRGQDAQCDTRAPRKRRPGRAGRRGWGQSAAPSTAGTSRMLGSSPQRGLWSAQRPLVPVVPPVCRSCAKGVNISPGAFVRWAALRGSGLGPPSTWWETPRSFVSERNTGFCSPWGLGPPPPQFPCFASAGGPNQPPLDNNGWTERCVTGVGWGNGHTGKEKRAALCG